MVFEDTPRLPPPHFRSDSIQRLEPASKAASVRCVLEQLERAEAHAKAVNDAVEHTLALMRQADELLMRTTAPER